MKNKGVTLIELMVVVAIIGLLVTTVLPSYRHYVLETQRSDTQAKLLQILQLQERFFIDNFTYTTDLTDLGYPTDPLIVSYKGDPAFSVSARACADPVVYADNPTIELCFQVFATALGVAGGGGQVDDGDLLVDNRGRKIHNFAGIVLRDWNGNDLPAGSCPDC